MTLRVDLGACWILHRRPWRESSLILDALTRDSGRVSLVARGARGPRSPWRGLAEPFRPLKVSFSMRGEMGTLSGIESDGRGPGLTGEALWCGFYINELMVRLLPREDPLPGLFDQYGQSLQAMADPRQRAPALRRLEMALLVATGVAPDFRFDVDTGDPIAPEGFYSLADETGARAVVGPGRNVFTGRVFLALADGTLEDPGLLRDARQVMRRLLAFHLGDKPLYTRNIMKGEP